MTPSKQIAAFLAKFAPEIASQARACLAKLRKRLPGAVELVYDYGFQLVFSFGATERGIDAPLALAVAPKGISLFIQRKGVPDPEKRLLGRGKLVRYVPLETPSTLNDPYVVKLMEAALARAEVPINRAAKRMLVIKSSSAAKRR